MAKTIRNEINRCIREHVSVRQYTFADVLRDRKILERVGETYSAMYQEKGMGKVLLPVNDFLAYAANKSFYLTAAIIDGQEVVYHAYVTDEANTRLLISCSEFRVADKALRNAIGRANKYLHWEDMMFFKDLGVKKYDWGGVSSFENPNGIDKFKMGFGGIPVEYYNITYIFGWKAKLIDLIRKMVRI